MRSFNQEMRERFGCKVYKLSLQAEVTCPNRDGSLGSRGCIFCSAGGSGDFAAERTKSISEQILEAKKRVSKKIKDGQGKYLVYFQSFTNTYVSKQKIRQVMQEAAGEISEEQAAARYLREIFTEAMAPDDVVGLSIGTRPDCLGPEMISLIRELALIKPVWVELGLQTIHEETAKYIRRAYALDVYDKAVRDLKDAGAFVVVHVILGLPKESPEDMEETVRYVVRSGADGIKLQLLHVLKNTDLADDYREGKVPLMTLEEYVALLSRLIPLIPDDVTVHRLTGDGPKKLLIAPLWSGDKKRVLNEINRMVSSLQESNTKE